MQLKALHKLAFCCTGPLLYQCLPELCVQGNPRFLLVLAIEVIIGGSAKLSAEKEFRKEHFKQVWAIHPRQAQTRGA